MSVTVNELKHQIDCAMGRSVCETCITNARLVDVFTGTILENAEIYIDQGKIIDSAAIAKQAPNKRLTLMAPT